MIKNIFLDFKNILGFSLSASIPKQIKDKQACFISDEFLSSTRKYESHSFAIR